MNDSQLETLADQVAAVLAERESNQSSVLQTVGEVAIVAGVCYVAFRAVQSAVYRNNRKLIKKLNQEK